MRSVGTNPDYLRVSSVNRLKPIMMLSEWALCVFVLFPLVSAQQMYLEQNWLPHTDYYMYRLDCDDPANILLEDEFTGRSESIPYAMTLEEDTRVCSDFFTASYINSKVLETDSEGNLVRRTGDVRFDKEGNSTVYDSPCCKRESKCKPTCYVVKVCSFVIWPPGSRKLVVRRGKCSSCQAISCPNQCANGEVCKLRLVLSLIF